MNVGRSAGLYAIHCTRFPAGMSVGITARHDTRLIMAATSAGIGSRTCAKDRTATSALSPTIQKRTPPTFAANATAAPATPSATAVESTILRKRARRPNDSERRRTVPVVRDYTNGNPSHNVNPQSVIARCPPDQPNRVGGGGGGGTDPVYRIHCSGAASCAGTGYSVGQSVDCVNTYGAYTTGCGGQPGSGSGIGVFYLSNATCYLNFASDVTSCFAAASSPSPGSNLTWYYCLQPGPGPGGPGPKTQHHMNLAPNTWFTWETYSDASGESKIGMGYPQPDPEQSGAYLIVWDAPAMAASTSNVTMYGWTGWLPKYLGYALAITASTTCTETF